MSQCAANASVCIAHDRGYAPTDVADERSHEDGVGPDDALDTAALLDQGEQLLAESARLLRRLDAALDHRRPDGDPPSPQSPQSPPPAHDAER